MELSNTQRKLSYVIITGIIITSLFLGYSLLTTGEGPELNNIGLDSVQEEKVWLKLVIDGNEIAGESTIASLERADQIELSSFSHSIQTPMDSSGRVSGRTVHSPVVVTKYVDKSSPLMMQALSLSQYVELAEFRFFKPSEAGQEMHYYTIKLEDAVISSIRTFMVDGDDRVFEEIAFTYQIITWTDAQTGAEAMVNLRDVGA